MHLMYCSFVGVMFDQRIMLMHQQKKYLFVPKKKTKQTKFGTDLMCITPLFTWILKVWHAAYVQQGHLNSTHIIG